MDLFKYSVTQNANGLARHAESRLSLISRNIANADTPGFKGADLEDFGTSFDGIAMKATRAGHLLSPKGQAQASRTKLGTLASPNGNDISLEDQMQRMSDVRMEHELANGVYKSAMRVLRGSIGK
ncbi:flagellar basal body protein [Paracoccaceae bacterium GXU_MW_L88]